MPRHHAVESRDHDNSADYEDSDELLPTFDEDDHPARVWNLLWLVNPGDEARCSSSMPGAKRVPVPSTTAATSDGCGT